jgi:hypothetical protein
LVDHGENALNPKPLPSASIIRENADATAVPARTAGQEITATGAVSFSTMTVSTIGRILWLRPWRNVLRPA